jgi:uncharacterized protein (TIRG00374 family)
MPRGTYTSPIPATTGSWYSATRNLQSAITLNLRRVLTLLASLAITSVFLVLALRQVDFAKLAHAFASADYRLVAIAVLFTLTGYLARAARWSRLLLSTKPIRVSRLFPVLVVGFALNNLLPGRPGEFARAYALGQREDLSKTLGFATVVVERVADGIALLGFLLVAFIAFASLHLELPEAAKTAGILSAILFGVALAGLVFLLWWQDLALGLFHRATRYLPSLLAARLGKMLESFVVGLRPLQSPKDLATIGLLSIAVWACESTSYFLMLNAFGILSEQPIRAVAAVFMMVLINLGVLIPAAPGGLGPFEAAAVFALSAFGVNETGAASVALGSHALQYLLITGLGLLFVWREGISLAVANPTSLAQDKELAPR